MIYNFLRNVFFCFLLLTSISSSAFAQLNVRAVKGLIERVLPDEASYFEVAYIPKENNKDVFELESKGGKIVLRGNNGISVASAFNYYLRHYCHCLITWNEVNLELPDTLPMVQGVIHKTSPYLHRYYLNYCTFNYTMSWWDWDRWQKEIDWMAVNGINMPLALTGENAIWQKVYKAMGFTDEELSNFFSGPAFLAWFWMNNLDAWGGPLPQTWIHTHETLQKKILARERSLGMTPVLPAFTGHVPPGFKKKFPRAQVNQVKWGRNFPAVNILSPKDSLFTVIGREFLKMQTKEYGTNHYYSADVFNEMKPPTNDSLYLNDMSSKVYQSMYNVDTAAVWVMQGWLFHYDAKFWQPTQMKALLNAVPDNKMIILDLWSEKNPVWNQSEAYYGKPWIWNMLHNFGGRIYMEGCMQCVIRQPVSLLKDPRAGRLTGLGLTMEATEQNPVLYQLMLDNTWRHAPIDLKQWIAQYVQQRYGNLNEDALNAWKLLLKSVYSKTPSGFGGPNSVITMRPRLLDFKNKKEPLFGYSLDTLLEAWQLLLKAAPELKNNDGYQYDLVNTGRQVMADYAVLLEQKIADVYHDKEINEFYRLSRLYLSLIDDMDKLAGTRKEFLLGRWLEDAKSWARSPQEELLYEFNARNLITLWGGKSSTLHDYARKQWSGLLKGFYKRRWEKFFAYASTCLKNHTPLDMKTFNVSMENLEWEWGNMHNHYSNVPIGDPVTVSEAMFTKYLKPIKNKLNNLNKFSIQ